MNLQSETDLNPLIPGPLEVIVAIIACGAVALVVVGVVVFFALRRSAAPRQTQQPEGPTEHRV
ncbi:MAG TPA: hypothetical protein VLB29_04425 [Nocardioidaceae bacterium]|nr:hypothetical protein [Nocardioidaceae bacterium]